MCNRFLLRNSLILFSAMCVVLAIQHSERRSQNSLSEGNEYDSEFLLREKRASRKPGFFKTLFSVIYEQFQDTRNTYRNVSRLINDNFLPENTPITEAPAVKNEGNVSTTAAPYRITRSEFYKIIRRNLRGLIRLYNIELKDALKQSDKYRKEFRKSASKEVSKFL